VKPIAYIGQSPTAQAGKAEACKSFEFEGFQLRVEKNIG
jgi:hypothetical protein